MNPELSPEDVIRAVRRNRGLEAGPPGNVILPNFHEVRRDESGNEIVPERPAPEPAASVTAAAEVVVEGDWVTASGQGFFEGHPLKLTQEEIEELKAFLSGVAVRQLEEERNRLRQHTAKRKGR